jgi:hypothetical protein
VLTTFSGVVLYIGLTVSLQKRMGQHLESPEKTKESANGHAVLFHWLEVPPNQINKVERTWMNSHGLKEGARPAFNKLDSPTYT